MKKNIKLEITPKPGDIWSRGKKTCFISNTLDIFVKDGNPPFLYRVWEDGKVFPIYMNLAPKIRPMKHGANKWKCIFRDGKPFKIGR